MLSRVARVASATMPRITSSRSSLVVQLPTRASFGSTRTISTSHSSLIGSGEGTDGTTVDVQHAQQQGHPPQMVGPQETNKPGGRRRKQRGKESKETLSQPEDQTSDELDVIREDREDEIMDTRHHFDAFRGMVNQLMHDFDDSIGGGFLTDRDRGRMSRRGRNREDRGWLSSLLPFTPPSRFELPFGLGERQTGSGRHHQPHQQDQRQLAPSQRTDDRSVATTGGNTSSGLTSAISPVLSPILDLMTATAPPIAIRLDVEEKDNAYAITADVPGLKPTDLKINVDRGVLTIEGKHHEERREEDPNRHFLRVERALGTVRRSLRLPENVDSSKVQAKYEAGTLKIELPKKPQSESTGNVKILDSTTSGMTESGSGTGASSNGSEKKVTQTSKDASQSAIASQ